MVGCTLGLATGPHLRGRSGGPAAGKAFMFPFPVIEGMGDKQKLYSRKLT